jgi:putative methyltransferase (TIGR04325 family)
MNGWQFANKWLGPAAIKFGQACLSFIGLYKPRLVYSKDGWNTIINSADAHGWNDKNIVGNKEAAFKQVSELLSSTNKVAFSYESKNLTSDQNLEYHNINMTFAYVLALASRMKTSVSVLDWGSGMGHYYLMAKKFLPDVQIDYHCVEVPEMAKLGKAINNKVSWYADDSYLNKKYDLVMINASLQYVKEWKEFFKTISPSVSKFLFVTRVPAVQNVKGFVAVQNENGIKMLHQQLNASELVEAIENCGFHTTLEFLIGDKPYIKNAPEQCEMKGWLFKKQDTSVN